MLPTPPARRKHAHALPAGRPAPSAAWRRAIGAATLATLVSSVVATEVAAQAARTATAPTSDYWVYVGAESADLIHRVRFGPGGTTVEKTTAVGELAAEMEGPHGLQISRDGKYLHMTTGHGTPDGKYWKYALGPDTLVGPPIFLGFFPATPRSRRRRRARCRTAAASTRAACDSTRRA